MLRSLGLFCGKSRVMPTVLTTQAVRRVLQLPSRNIKYNGQFLFHKMYSHSQPLPVSKQSQKINDEIMMLQSKLKTEILESQKSSRPTKQQLLSEANGFLDKFKIRSKWFLIRDNRPFNLDELGTLFSWFFLAQILWFILGTTTFVSLLLFSIDAILGTNKDFTATVLNKGWGGKNISFDIKGDVLPHWSKGCISMKNLRIKTLNQKDTTPEDSFEALESVSFDVNINTIELTLSLRKWLKGHGLVDAVTIIGINGDINIVDDPMLSDWIKNKNYIVNKIVVQDAKIMYNHTYDVTIFNMKLPRFRFNNSIHDILNSAVVSGAINNSLFTIHKRQQNLASIKDASEDISSTWERITRIHLDQIPVRQLGLTDSDSFSWIDDGEVEFTADVMLPIEAPEKDEFVFADYNNDLAGLDGKDVSEELMNSNKYLVVDLKLKFKDLKAKIPNAAPKLSTKEVICKLDELRPLVEYVNSKRNWYYSIKERYDSSYIQSDTGDESSSTDLYNSSDEQAIFPKFQTFFNDGDSFSASFPQITVKTWPEDEDNDLSGKEIVKYHNVDPNNNNEIILTCRIVANTQDIKGKILLQDTKLYDIITMELYYDLMKVVEDWEYKNSHDWRRLWTATVLSQILLLGLGSVA